MLGDYRGRERFNSKRPDARRFLLTDDFDGFDAVGGNLHFYGKFTVAGGHSGRVDARRHRCGGSGCKSKKNGGCRGGEYGFRRMNHWPNFHKTWNCSKEVGQILGIALSSENEVIYVFECQISEPINVGTGS